MTSRFAWKQTVTSLSPLLFIAAWISGAGELHAAERVTAQSDEARSIDLFAAVASGDLDAQFIPKSAAAGTVILTNTTERPLQLRLPEAFAGVPVLAQFGAGLDPNNGRNGGNNGGNGGNQSVGGAFPNAGQGQNGPGIFSVEPGRPRKLKVVSVCLDFGQPDPNPRVPYQLVPLSSRSSDSQLAALVQTLGRGRIDQPAAQAAAWHLASGLSWDDLAAKARAVHIGGASEPLFTPAQLARARECLKSLEPSEVLAMQAARSSVTSRE